MEESGDRAISEMASTLTLVAVTFVVVAAVGVNVLFVSTDSTDGPDASFTYDHFDEQQILVIEHDTGDPIPAGQLLIRGPRSEATWSQTNNQVNNSTLIGPGNVTQISASGAFDQPVSSDMRIDILYVNRTAETSRVLSQWNGTN